MDIRRRSRRRYLTLFNGSMYFLCASSFTFSVLQSMGEIPISRRFLAAMYIIDIVLATQSVGNGSMLLEMFIDPLTSILTCRFMISLWQFDSALASTTSGPQLRELTTSTVLQFAAQPSDSLPASIASFAHPIHLGSEPSEVELDEIIDNGAEGRDIDVDESSNH